MQVMRRFERQESIGNLRYLDQSQLHMLYVNSCSREDKLAISRKIGLFMGPIPVRPSKVGIGRVMQKSRTTLCC